MRGSRSAAARVAACVVSFVVACTPPASEAGERRHVGAETTSPARAWLWRIDGCGPSPSYVLGTLHAGVRFSVALPSPLDRALYDARVVLFEIDFRTLPDPYDWPPPEPGAASLETILSPESWALLLEAVGTTVSRETLAAASPGRAAEHLYDLRTAEVEAAAEGRAPHGGPSWLDRSIFAWALAVGRPVVGLETREERETILEGFHPPDAQLAWLERLIADPDGTRAIAETVRRMYVELDQAGMTAREERAHSDADRASIVDRRNQLWLPRLLAELRAGNAFVAVGLGHLLGEGSLVDLIEGEGCAVARVMGDGGFVAGEPPPLLVE